MNKIREECGVFGIFAPDKRDVASSVYYGLYALQHRGQESCGIVVNDDGLFQSYKDTGLVNDVFTSDVMRRLGEGNMAVGHVRYGTTGVDGRLNCQPIVVNHIKGRMALAHNGNLVNSFELRRELEMQGSIFHTTSDTEVISYIITKERLAAPSIEQAVNRFHSRQGQLLNVVADFDPRLHFALFFHGRKLVHPTEHRGGGGSNQPLSHTKNIHLRPLRQHIANEVFVQRIGDHDAAIGIAPLVEHTPGLFA